VAGDQKAYELLVLKYQRRIERLIGRMVRDTDLIEDIARKRSSAVPGAVPVPRRGPVLYLAVSDRGQYCEKALVDLKRDPVVSESSLRGGV
jgi:RNA polymerase sigma-70 factor (ECF subfamily)